MKKLILMLLFAPGTSAFAQRFSAGVKGGINVSNFTGGNFSSVKKKAMVGFYGGGFINFCWAKTSRCNQRPSFPHKVHR